MKACLYSVFELIGGAIAAGVLMCTHQSQRKPDMPPQRPIDVEVPKPSQTLPPSQTFVPGHTLPPSTLPPSTLPPSETLPPSQTLRPQQTLGGLRRSHQTSSEAITASSTFVREEGRYTNTA